MNACCLLLIAALGDTPSRAIDFDTEIISILTKSGCNAGACHGAAAGRGEFHLSLLGGNPAADYSAIVHEFEGRRVHLAKPDLSLLLAKPTGQIAHGGEQPLEADGAGAKLIHDWIAQGAPRGDSRDLSELQVTPERLVVDRLDAEVDLSATARFDDGAAEDVTAWTVFTSADPSAVEIDAAASRAIVRRRGQHLVIARYLDRIVPIRLVLPYGDAPLGAVATEGEQFIDVEVRRTLTELRIPESPGVDDAGFLRRVTLDLTGRLPARGEIEAFLADASIDKDARAIDRLLASDEFVEFWTFRLATWLRLRSPVNERAAANAYHGWLREQIRLGTPWNVIARELLVATGDSHRVGPANFARTAGDARQHAELASEVFLGVRLKCANCHDHPLDRWTMDDYHGLAAVFARLDRGREVRVMSRGAVTNPRSGEPAIPRLPGELSLGEAGDPRAAFADWLTRPENPYFARAMVNRLWKSLLGRGLVEPVDDLRATNPASHPELIDRLAEDFVAHGYNLRHTLRTIALSNAYQRGAATNENAFDEQFYSHALERTLGAEVLADAIADVTGVPEAYAEGATRAVELVDASVPAPALEILGRCDRTQSCESVAEQGGVPARLHLLNGEFVNRKLADASGVLRCMMAEARSDDEIVTEFYFRALCRAPRQAEREHWMNALNARTPDERGAALEDFVWSLLNCREFATNH
jgi:hypothetical protein